MLSYDYDDINHLNTIQEPCDGNFSSIATNFVASYEEKFFAMEILVEGVFFCTWYEAK